MSALCQRREQSNPPARSEYSFGKCRSNLPRCGTIIRVPAQHIATVSAGTWHARVEATNDPAMTAALASRQGVGRWDGDGRVAMVWKTSEWKCTRVMRPVAWLPSISKSCCSSKPTW